MMSPTQQKWVGRWEQLVGRAKSLWGLLIANDLMKVEGDREATIGSRKERVAQAREEFADLLKTRLRP